MTISDLIAELKQLIDIEETHGHPCKAKNRLGPPATKQEIHAVETQRGVTLPGDYRAFLEQHNGWSGFSYDYDLFSTEQLTTPPQNIKEMAKDYAAYGDPLPSTGLVIQGGPGRQFVVYDIKGTCELVAYDLGPGKRWPSFTAYLRAAKDEVEQTNKEAML